LNDGGSARSSAIHVPEVEPSLLHRFFLLFGTTPYRRWEVMHLRMIVWCLLLAYLGWRFLACAPQKWTPVLFFLELSCIAFLLISLSFLLYTGSSSPSSLPCEIRKLAPWVRWTTVTLVLVTWAMAGAVFTSHMILEYSAARQEAPNTCFSRVPSTVTYPLSRVSTADLGPLH
jgi:hypothetical protein